MSVATKGARGLIVGKKEDDVGTLGVELEKEKKEEAGEDVSGEPEFGIPIEVVACEFRNDSGAIYVYDFATEEVTSTGRVVKDADDEGEVGEVEDKGADVGSKGPAAEQYVGRGELLNSGDTKATAAADDADVQQQGDAAASTAIAVTIFDFYSHIKKWH